MAPAAPDPRRPATPLLGGSVAAIVLIWSFNFIFGKFGLRHWTPLELASFRVTLAALIILPVYLVFRPRRTRLRRRDLWVFAYLGLFGAAGNQMCFTIGLSYTTVGHSALIIAMGPILVLLLARLQGLEALTWRKAMGMTLSFAGVIVLAAEHGLDLRSVSLRGDLITLVGSTSFAFYTVLGKKVAVKYDSLSMNAFNYFAGALVALPLTAHEAWGMTRGGQWGAMSREGWAALVYMALFASVTAYLIYYWLLRHMAASRLATFAYLQPILTTVLGVWLLGESVSGSLVVGGALVLVGVYQIESAPRENHRNEK